MGSISERERREREAERAQANKDFEGLVDACSEEIARAIRESALQHSLPWRLDELRKAGERGVLWAAAKKYDPTLGYSFQRQAWKWIAGEVWHEAVRLAAEAQGAEESAPVPNAATRRALETFSAPEWEGLIEGFEAGDLKILRTYLDANREPLTAWLGKAKFYKILDKEATRSMLLALEYMVQSGYKTTLADAARHVAFFHAQARLLKIKRAEKPPGVRSWAEVSSERSLVEMLNRSFPRAERTTRHRVRKMVARMKTTPPSQFDGSMHDYYLWTTDPDSYKHELRLGKAEKPRLKPDPYFFSPQK